MSNINIFHVYFSAPGEDENLQHIAVEGIASTPSISTPAIQVGEPENQTITPSSIASTGSIPSPQIAVENGQQTISTVGIAAITTLSSPSVKVEGIEQTIVSSAIAPIAATGSPFLVAEDPYYGYRLTFTPADTYSIGAEELSYTVRTAPSGGNTVYSGTATSGVEEITDIIDDPFLVEGENIRYIRLVDDGGNTITSGPITIILSPGSSYITMLGIPSIASIGSGTELFNGRIGAFGIPSSIDFGTQVVERGFRPEKEPFSIHKYFAGLYGPVEYQVGLRYYTPEGILVGDLKDDLVDLTLDWDMSRAVQRTMSCTLLGSSANIPHTYILEPYAIAQVYNPNINQIVPEEFVFAQYIQSNPRQSIGTSTRRMITAYDMTNKLVEKTIEDQLIIAQGDNYGGRIRYLAIEAGFQDRKIALPITYETLPTPLTFEPGTSYYDIISLLADAVNWSKPFMTNNNTLRIIERKDLTEREKTRVFATDNSSSILPNIEYEFDIRKIVNKVVININDPLRTPETVSYINDNLQNPYSRSTSGKTVTEVLDNFDHLASTEIAEERAKLEAQIFSSNASIELSVLPDFTLGPHEVYSLIILDQETGEPLIYSDWFAESWSMQMDIGQPTKLQLRSILPV